MKEDLLKMIFYYESCATSDFDIIQWAMNQVATGSTLELINRLAEIDRPEPGEVKKLLCAIIKEKGYDYPDEKALRLYRVKMICEQIVSGKLSPHKGCSLISRIESEKDWPNFIADFQILNRDIEAQPCGQGKFWDEALNGRIAEIAREGISSVNQYLDLE